MRRDQSKTGSDYRREHNAEMWDRPVRDPVEVVSHIPDWPWAEWVMEQGIGE